MMWFFFYHACDAFIRFNGQASPAPPGGGVSLLTGPKQRARQSSPSLGERKEAPVIIAFLF